MLTIHLARWRSAVVLAGLSLFLFLFLFLFPPSARADSWDWRDVDGKNYMTPAKCEWANRPFAGIATFEVRIKIVLERPDLDIDLSEWHINHNSPGGNGIGQICGLTMWGKGVLTEAEVPYYMDPLILAPDWEDRAYSCTAYQLMWIADEDADRGKIQQWLRQYGPLYVESDHANTLVGYDDERQEWIVKETYGSFVGDDGYFYHDYGYMTGKVVQAFTGDVYCGPTLLPEPASAFLLLAGLPLLLRRRTKGRREGRARCGGVGAGTPVLLVAAAVSVCLAPPLARGDSWDWRNVDGKNYMTPAKAQGYMECRQFAGIAALEAKIKIILDDPNLDIDLSERHVIHSNPGRSGCVLFSGKSERMGTGVLTEAEMPYDMDPVVFAADWELRAYSISDFTAAVVYDEVAMRGLIQQWLRQYGPIYTEDYHGNTLVGYDDDAQKWIIKETGGPDYGDNGYWYLDYGYMDGRCLHILTGDVYYGGELLPEPGAISLLAMGALVVIRRTRR